LFVIEYVTSGLGYIESEGKKTEVHKGDLYIIHRRTVHTYYSDAKQPYSKKWINLSGSFINAMADVFLGKEPFTVLPIGEPAEHIIDGIHASLSNSEADISQTECSVMRQLLELFMLIDTYRKQGQGQMSLFEKICEYIDHNIFSDISLSSICEKFFISSSTLYRVFKTNTGLSPKEYVQSKKIEVAKRMIAANDSSLNSIAAALNFYDSHHFFHSFRTATGMSPSEYKKAVLQETEQ
jgi:AraC-like DNA-binding protein